MGRASVRSSLRSAAFPPLRERCASLSEQESPPKKSAPSSSPAESSEVRDALTESVTRSTTFSAPRREPSRKSISRKGRKELSVPMTETSTDGKALGEANDKTTAQSCDKYPELRSVDLF